MASDVDFLVYQGGLLRRLNGANLPWYSPQSSIIYGTSFMVPGSITTDWSGVAAGAGNAVFSNAAGLLFASIGLSSTPGSLANYIKTEANVSGQAAVVTVDGSDANATLYLTGKGTQPVVLGGAGGVLMGTSSSDKLAFFGGTPAIKPTLTGAWAGNTAGRALSQLLQSLGLIVDSTTA